MAKLKSTKDLRAFLVDQMEGVAEGRVEAEKSKGVANLAQQIYNTLNLELRFATAQAKLEDKPILPVPFDD